MAVLPAVPRAHCREARNRQLQLASWLVGLPGQCRLSYGYHPASTQLTCRLPRCELRGYLDTRGRFTRTILSVCRPPPKDKTRRLADHPAISGLEHLSWYQPHARASPKRWEDGSRDGVDHDHVMTALSGELLYPMLISRQELSNPYILINIPSRPLLLLFFSEKATRYRFDSVLIQFSDHGLSHMLEDPYITSTIFRDGRRKPPPLCLWILRRCWLCRRRRRRRDSRSLPSPSTSFSQLSRYLSSLCEWQAGWRHGFLG